MPLLLGLGAGALAFVVGGVLLALDHFFLGIVVALCGVPIAIVVWMAAGDRA
jgi:hypothetical protein